MTAGLAVREARKRKILVVGGLLRLAPQYRTEDDGISVVVENTASMDLKQRLKSVDAVVLVPTKISHVATSIVRKYTRRNGVALLHAAGAGVAEVRHTIERAAMAMDQEGKGG